VVNARHLKHVPGRKTDVKDCQWIQYLHTCGLLSGSFRPEAEMCALRAYLRHRATLLDYRAAHIQHMQKALQQMNVQLPQVLTDITGTTGLAIIRAIVAGERDPIHLARFRDPRCAHSTEEIAKALTGHYRAEHVFPCSKRWPCMTSIRPRCTSAMRKSHGNFRPSCLCGTTCRHSTARTKPSRIARMPLRMTRAACCIS
jgi:hypothetical protein